MSHHITVSSEDSRFPLLSTPYSKLMTLFHLSLILLKQSGENVHIFLLPNLSACLHLYLYLLLSLFGNSASSKATFLCTGSHFLNYSEVSSCACPPLPYIINFFLLHHCYQHRSMLKYLPFVLPHLTATLYRKVFYIPYLYFLSSYSLLDNFC